MRYFSFILLIMGLIFPAWSFAEAPSTPSGAAARHGCRVIDVQCSCINPVKNFVVENQKLGRSNPGEPGECKLKPEIDSQAGKMPIAYCLRGESVKDVRQGESQCKATWTCKEPCTL